MAPRLIVLGWDSATFDVADPLLQEGSLPALASLIERGIHAPLRSTWPPMTDCAWTSAFTGLTAAGHGIFGSWYRAPGAYACRYFSGRDRTAPAVWELTEDVRWLVWNVPMTYPPRPVQGGIVAGYGAPPGARVTQPAAFQEELAAHHPLADLMDVAPHGSLERFLDDLLRGLRAQGPALVWAAQHIGADCVVAVWPHIDRAQHFFWRFRGGPEPLGDAIDEVYRAMDAATATVLEAFPDADVMVVSDHGAGPLFGDVNVAAWLTAHGYATPVARRSLRAVPARAAWALPPVLRRAARRVAPGLARRTMAQTLASGLAPFDWDRTTAFFGVHSDLWLNLEGREPRGIVSPDDADEVLDEVLDGLLAATDPRTGRPLFAGAIRRRDYFTGPHRDLAPDAIVDTWSAGYRIAPGRAVGRELVTEPAALAGVSASWSADHRPLGILAAAGPRIARGAIEEPSLLDVAPTMLALLEQPVPEGLDGAVAAGLPSPSFLQRHPVRTAQAERTLGAAGGDYSEDEAAAVAAHLRDLGYIE